jgi:hypothetical protein
VGWEIRGVFVTGEALFLRSGYDLASHGDGSGRIVVKGGNPKYLLHSLGLYDGKGIALANSRTAICLHIFEKSWKTGTKKHEHNAVMVFILRIPLAPLVRIKPILHAIIYLICTTIDIQGNNHDYHSGKCIRIIRKQIPNHGRTK